MSRCEARKDFDEGNSQSKKYQLMSNNQLTK